jgi:hypothetical protein
MGAECTVRDDLARAELGYQPVIGIDEGIARLTRAGRGRAVGTT